MFVFLKHPSHIILIRSFKYVVSILIADDSASIRVLLKDVLSFGDHQVIGEAVDGADALEKYETLRPDVLLLDLAMPKLSGIEVLQQLQPKYPQMKVIVITANGSDQVYRKCKKYGAIGYIDKPFDFQDVLVQIEEVTKLITIEKSQE